MSLSPNNAQMRELSELRNHLKWLDEERRKSTRKMAEMEQRLAQQGRDLAERDQKITELEWHVANFNQRFERMPDTTDTASEVDQRLQDLEWHVSSMNAVMARVPAPELLEQQAAEINALREANFELSGRLRETTESLAADSQSSLNTLAQSIQNHLDTALEENTSRMDATIENFSARFNTLTTDNSSRLDALTAAGEQRLAEIEQRINALSSDYDSRLADLRSVDLSPEIMRLDERFREVDDSRQAWESRFHQLEQNFQQLEQNIEKQGNMREFMPVLDRIEQELELRQAEELRLSNLLTAQEERFNPLSAAVEDLDITNTTLNNRLIDSEKTIQELEARVRAIDENVKPIVDETNRRIAPLLEKVTALTNSAMKTEAGLQAMSSDQIELREILVNTTDELQRQQSETTRQLEDWQVTMDENKDTIERFTQQWITLSNQYKEARMAVQNFAHWQKQLEQQKREASEMLRLESNRMQSRWDGFLLEVQEKLKNFEIDFGQKWQAFELENEQKWSATRRSEKLWREEISAVDDLIQKLQQDNRNLIWRVQSAQADAIKKWPRLLMEEVEKAVEINPNRRLTSMTTPPSGEMSVVDAIEQGLITIDYNDDTDFDN